VFPAAKALGTP